MGSGVKPSEFAVSGLKVIVEVTLNSGDNGLGDENNRCVGMKGGRSNLSRPTRPITYLLCAEAFFNR